MTVVPLSLPAEDDGPFVFASGLAPNPAGGPLHRHARLRERFLVTEGRLLVTLGDACQARSLLPRDSIDVSTGLLHAFRNAQPVTTEVRIADGLGAGFERFLRATLGLALDGRVGTDGLPRDPRLRPILLDHADMTFPGPFARGQRRAIGAFASALRRLGVERSLLAYWTGARRADAA